MTDKHTADDVERIAVSLTAEELHILRHSLGVPDPGQTRMYRNHFVTGEGGADWSHCLSLVGKGAMQRRPGSPLTGGDDLFIVTELGRAIVRRILQEPSK